MRRRTRRILRSRRARRCLRARARSPSQRAQRSITSLPVIQIIRDQGPCRVIKAITKRSRLKGSQLKESQLKGSRRTQRMKDHWSNREINSRISQLQSRCRQNRRAHRHLRSLKSNQNLRSKLHRSLHRSLQARRPLQISRRSQVRLLRRQLPFLNPRRKRRHSLFTHQRMIRRLIRARKVRSHPSPGRQLHLQSSQSNRLQKNLSRHQLRQAPLDQQLPILQLQHLELLLLQTAQLNP